MEATPLEHQPSREVTVLAHTLADLAYFLDADGQPVAPARHVKSPPVLSSKILALATLNVELGQGSHNFKEVQDALGLTYTSAHKLVTHLDAMAPPEVLEYTPREHQVVIGHIAVAEVISTDRDKEIFSNPKSAAAKAERNRQLEIMAEKSKIELSDYDHMLVRGRDEKAYKLPLDSPDAIVLARVLEGLGEFMNRNRITNHDLIQMAWRRMTRFEKSLFVDEQEPYEYLEIYRALAPSVKKSSLN